MRLQYCKWINVREYFVDTVESPWIVLSECYRFVFNLIFCIGDLEQLVKILEEGATCGWPDTTHLIKYLMNEHAFLFGAVPSIHPLPHHPVASRDRDTQPQYDRAFPKHLPHPFTWNLNCLTIIGVTIVSFPFTVSPDIFAKRSSWFQLWGHGRSSLHRCSQMLSTAGNNSEASLNCT